MKISEIRSTEMIVRPSGASDVIALCTACTGTSRVAASLNSGIELDSGLRWEEGLPPTFCFRRWSGGPHQSIAVSAGGSSMSWECSGMPLPLDLTQLPEGDKRKGTMWKRVWRVSCPAGAFGGGCDAIGSFVLLTDCCFGCRDMERGKGHAS